MKLDEPILVSLCLLGVNCRYNQTSKLNRKIIDALKGKKIIPVCPEALSGLGFPRPPAEIEKGDGFSVLSGKSRVIDQEGKDLTRAFITGAKEALKLAKIFSAKTAILKDRSPSCGVNYVYNQGRLVPGVGIFTALLLKEKLSILSEREFKD